MSFEEVASFSNFHTPQNVQDSVPAWLLATQFRFEQGPRLPNALNCSQDVDASSHQEYGMPKSLRSSIPSIDDNISLSDSAHESYSSESSSETSYTSLTDSSDTFLDEDNRDQLPQLTKVDSCPIDEIQELAFRAIPINDQATSDNNCGPCPLGNAVRKFTRRVSGYCKTSRNDGSQQLPSMCLPFRSGDANANTDAQHRSSRRSACSISRPCPPKLRRDTETTDQFVALLIIFAKRLITAIWPLSDRPPMMTDCFNGAGVLPLEAFIRETLRRSKTSFSTLQVALYYLVLLRSRATPGSFTARCKGEDNERAQCRAMQCGRRMFLSALMLASKYLQDRNYSARAWSKISGLRSNEINDNEREYLAQINYDLHVPKEIFENWSKIVSALSKLSNEGAPGPFNAGDGSPGAGSNSSLAAMVSQVDPEDGFDIDQHAFSDSWWTSILRKLEPNIVKHGALTDFFLRTYLPSDKVHGLAPTQHMINQVNPPLDCSSPTADSAAYGCDLNFSDLRSRNSQPCKTQSAQMPQILGQMSPAKSLELPSRPQLGNLPTPQTTPRISDQSPSEKGCMRPSLRCASSMDVMRSLRKQCFMNANLERCPPPQPQSCALPPMKYFPRPAETPQEHPISYMAPSVSSPASVLSDATTLTTSTSRSRSRSSSISSVSSWSSWAPPISHLRKSAACTLSSPLSRVCSLPETRKPASTDPQTTEAECMIQQCSIPDQTSVGSSADGRYTGTPQQVQNLPTSSEVAAIHGLMSLSAHSEPPSQSVTPTPQRLSDKNDAVTAQCFERLRDHKRKLSKIESDLQAQVKTMLSDGSWPIGVTEDHRLPYGGTSHRQTQLPTSLRKENRWPVSTPSNNKRQCSQQTPLTPPADPLSGRRDLSMLVCR